MNFAAQAAIYLILVAFTWMLIRDCDHGECEECGGRTTEFDDRRCSDCERELGSGE